MGDGNSAYGDRQTILFVEDDADIRSIISQYLRECGYRIIEADNGADALRALESDCSVDLVFTDVLLPGAVDGFALARWLSANRPEIKVLLTSGVPRSAELVKVLCDHGPLLEKPYHHEQLVERIKLALGEYRRSLQNESGAA